MMIQITQGEGVGTVSSLDSFLKLNEFEDEYAAEIEQALDLFGEYTGGGGASPEWTIKTKWMPLKLRTDL